MLIPENKMIEMYMPLFVTSLLNVITEYKMFMGIEKNFQKNGGNKVPMEMRINSYIVSYYNPYFYGS